MAENDSLLARMFGDYPLVRILDTLIDHPDHEYTKKELAEINDISYPVIHNAWNKLERFRIVSPTRKVGNSQLFILNQESPVVRCIYKLKQELLKIEEERVTA